MVAAALETDSALDRLNASLGKLNVSAVDRMTTAASKLTAASAKETSATARLENARTKASLAAAQATINAQKLAAAQSAASAAADRAAAASARAKIALMAEELAALKLAAAREKSNKVTQDTVPVIDKSTTSLKANGLQIANVTAQFNDIGVMMASGQSPFQLAMQQGTQLNQVFTQMRSEGKSVASVLVSGFTSMLNPMALATIGTIALGSAIVNWMTSGAEKTKSFADTLSEANTAINNLKAASDVYTASGLTALAEKYGEVNAELLTHIERLRTIAEMDALKKNAEMLQAIEDSIPGGWLTTQVDEVRIAFDTTNDRARQLIYMFQEIQNASTFDEQADAITRMREEIESTTGGLDNATGAAANVLVELVKAEDAALRMKAAAPDGGWMDAAIGGVGALVNRIWDAVDANRVLAKEQAAARREAAAAADMDGRAAYGAGQAAYRDRMRESSALYGGDGSGLSADEREAISPTARPSRRAGGGGGESAADRMKKRAEAADQLRDKLRSLDEQLVGSAFAEQAALDEVTARQQERLELLKEAQEARILTEEQAAARVVEINKKAADEMLAIEQARKSVMLKSAQDMFGSLADAAKGFAGEQSGIYKALFIASKAFAIADSIIKIQQGIANAMVLPFPANLAAAATVAAQTASIVSSIQAVQFADGGFVRGPGGPRDDAIAARLSNGEFVINARATARNRPLLEAINSGNERAVYRRNMFADGGEVQAAYRPANTAPRVGNDVQPVQNNVSFRIVTRDPDTRVEQSQSQRAANITRAASYGRRNG